MAIRRQKIRGTTLQLDQDLGLAGMLAVDVEKNNIRLYDGIVLGGYEILNATQIAALYTLPSRLGTTGIDLTGGTRSANEADKPGYYYTNALTTDQPEAATGAIHVTVSQAGLGIHQTWIKALDGNMWKRVRSAAGVWSAWERIVDQEFLESASANAYNAARLGGQLPAYYTAIATRLGYTPANKAGDTFTGAVNFDALASFDTDVTIGGDVAVTGIAYFNSIPQFMSSQIDIAGAAPRIRFNQTDTTPDYIIQVNVDGLYMLIDRDGNGGFDPPPYPFEINDTDKTLFIYGSKVWMASNDGAGSGLDADTLDGKQATDFVLPTRSVIAGNGLTGGGTLAADRTVTLGTPGNITNSTTNSVTATSHTHALGFTAAEVFTGGDVNYTTFPIGHPLVAICPATIRTAPVALYLHATATEYYTSSSGGTALSGTWRTRGYISGDRTLFQRTA